MVDRPYESRYGGGKFTVAEWLAESMVDRQAREKGINLPQKFWDDRRFKSDFVKQIRFAYQLLKVYEVESILLALRSKEGKRIYSLGAARWLDPLIQKEQRKLIQERREAPERPTPPPPTTPTVAEAPRLAFVPRQKSILSKLREFDGRHT